MRAFLGMGLLGTNFVRALLKKGVEVNVWNRTASRASALEAEGARAFANIVDAVKGAEIIHVTLKDDASINEVLENARDGFQPGAIIIDHTTTSVEGAIERTKTWKERGYIYLHAPVFMGPVNALESTGNMMVSGDQSVVEKYSPILSEMTGKLINLGEEEGKAAGMKLVGNCFLVAFTTGIAETLSLAKALHIPVKDVASLFELWNPAAMLPARMQRLTSGVYNNPSWELNMARKDTGLFIKAAEREDINLILMPAIAAAMDNWIERGHGNDDWTVIAKDSI